MTDTVSASMKIAGAKAAEAFGVILSFEQTAAIYAAMLAASPPGEGSSGDTTNMIAPVEAVACPTCKGAHPELCSNVFHISYPAPIKPSGDTGELREKIIAIIEDSVWADDATEFTEIIHGINDAADAILDLIHLEECETCYGSGKIFEAATTTGANQHSACQYDCEDCNGTGYNT